MKSKAIEVDALLCDCVRVREGLLHVLGGGVTVVYRSQFPATLGLDLAMLVRIGPEAANDHELRVAVERADGSTVGSIRAQFGVAPGVQRPEGESFSLPAAVSLTSVPLPAAETYVVQIEIDGHAVRRLPFKAEER